MDLRRPIHHRNVYSWAAGIAWVLLLGVGLAAVALAGVAVNELAHATETGRVAVSDDGTSCPIPPISTRAISLDLRDADLELVLRMLGKEAGANIVLTRGVRGTVTLSVDRTPLNQVLLAVLESNHLCWESIGDNILLVSPQNR